MKVYYKLILFSTLLTFAFNAIAGHGWSRVNYTNSTIFTGVVTVNGAPAANGDVIGIFVNGECRMISTVFNQDGKAYVSAVLHGEKVETATIKYWSLKENKIYDIDTTIETSPSNEILELPINLKSGEVTESKLTETTNEIGVYPTNARSFINIRSSSKEVKSVKIIDNIGNTVTIINELESNRIDVSTLSSGIYFVSVLTKDGLVTTKKIIKN